MSIFKQKSVEEVLQGINASNYGQTEEQKAAEIRVRKASNGAAARERRHKNITVGRLSARFIKAYAKPGKALSGVYFVQEGLRGPIKIGRAVDISKRMGLLQCGNSQELVFLGHILSDFDSELMEQKLHSHFRDYRIRGEWFEPCAELLAFCKVGEVVTDAG